MAETLIITIVYSSGRNDFNHSIYSIFPAQFHGKQNFHSTFEWEKSVLSDHTYTEYTYKYKNCYSNNMYHMFILKYIDNKPT